MDAVECRSDPENSATDGGGQATRLPLAAVTVAPECQLRAAASAATVADYAEALAAGAVFPPIVAFDDGERIWLADGFHRLEAHQAAGLAEIAVDLRDGTRRDAVLFAAGANATHGLRRTQADKARAIAVLLADPEWRRWSDKEIARRTGTSDKTVAKARRELSGEGVDAEIRVERTFITRHGTEAQRRVKPNGGQRPRRGNPRRANGARQRHLVERVLRGLPDDLLLAECRRRGLVGGRLIRSTSLNWPRSRASRRPSSWCSRPPTIRSRCTSRRGAQAPSGSPRSGRSSTSASGPTSAASTTAWCRGEPPILLPSGKPYLNTRAAGALVNASRDARYLGLVPIGAFVDRRNPEPFEMFAAQATGGLGVDDDGLVR